MAELIGMPRAAWRRQPQGPVRVNWANQLTKNPVFISLPGAARPVVYSSGIGSYPPNVGSPLRSGVRSVSSGGYGARYNGSLITFFRASSTDDAYIGVPIATDIAFGLSVDAIELIGNNPGFIRKSVFAIVEGATNKLWIRYNSSDYKSDNPLSFSGTINLVVSLKSGSRVSAAVNGAIVIDSSTTNTTPDMLGINGFNSIGANTATERVDGNYTNFYVFNRYLENYEIRELSLNPWQIFRSRPSRFILIPSSGGAGTATSVFSLDAFIQKTFSQTVTLDALLQSTFSSTISLDSLIAAVQSSTISLDALIQMAGSSAVSVDALLQATKAGMISVDALVQATLLNTLSLDALIKTSWTQTASFDALIQSVKLGTISLDALITGASGTSVSAVLDALIQAIQNKTLSLDALIQQAYTSNVALDAYIALVGTKAVSLDALLQMTVSGVVSLDALIQTTKAQFISFDALIQAAKSGTVSLDAILVLATTANLFLDAFVQKSLSVGVSLDAIIGAIADMILPTGRVILATASDRLVTSLSVDRMVSTLPTDRMII